MAACAVLVAGCGRIDLPADGTIACSPAADCPRDMRCADDGFCYRSPPPLADAAGAGDGQIDGDAADPPLLLDVAFEGGAGSTTGLEPIVEYQLVYGEGHDGEGLDMQSPSRLEYPARALLATQGTIELWVAPSWAADDGLNHHLVTWGYNHGLVLFRDANENLRLVINRFGTEGLPPAERGVGYNVGFVSAGTWYHVVATWSPTELALYVDGNQVGRTTDLTVFNAPGASVVIGSEAGQKYADALLDDLRTWSVALSADEIGARHAARSR